MNGEERTVINHLLGLKIIPHPLARDVRDVWEVVPYNLRARRRRWRVVKRHIDRPGCYQCGDVLYMHPELIAKLPKRTDA